MLAYSITKLQLEEAEDNNDEVELPADLSNPFFIFLGFDAKLEGGCGQRREREAVVVVIVGGAGGGVVEKEVEIEGAVEEIAGPCEGKYA
ncbi:unnamed protein product [Ilex paraguariensis]|uniref:Uncharacterized protein n=1 Tax=Ilex paraguariensis TaxID=185542 RepID=A0ABC8U5R3_9AQUA